MGRKPRPLNEGRSLSHAFSFRTGWVTKRLDRVSVYFLFPLSLFIADKRALVASHTGWDPTRGHMAPIVALFYLSFLCTALGVSAKQLGRELRFLTEVFVFAYSLDFLLMKRTKTC